MANETDDLTKGKDAPNVARPTTRVEVLVDNLGPDLLKKGKITSDLPVVALLKTQGRQQLVREVKG